MKIQYTTVLLAMLLAHGARAQYTTGTGNLNVVPGNGQPGNAAVAGSATVAGDITVAGSATVQGTVALTGARNNVDWIFYTDNNREGLYLNPNFNGSRETAFPAAMLPFRNA